MRRPLHIGIDGWELQDRRRGIGRYVFELCRQLDRHLPDATFFVYHRSPVEMPVDSGRWILRTDPSRAGRRLSSLLWLKLRGSMLCRQDHLDVFWATRPFLPFLPRRIKTVITVYDLCHELTPQTYDAIHLLGVRLFFARDVRKAGTVLTISQGTADRLYHCLGHRADAVIHPAVNETFVPQSEAAIARCLAHYRLTAPYLLTVATWEPRKNLERLVATFLAMKNQGLIPEHRMVLVGKKGVRYEALASLLDRDNGRCLVALGYVPDEHLAPLYAGADVFVFPSLYEGFGLPALEARACGARVVATDIPELREAGGPDAIYIEPTEAGIRQGILAALDRARPQPTRSSLPTWAEGAQRLAALLAMNERINTATV